VSAISICNRDNGALTKKTRLLTWEITKPLFEMQQLLGHPPLDG
jgi:hypothetical protein